RAHPHLHSFPTRRSSDLAEYYLALALHASDRNLEAIQQLEALLAEHPDDVAALYQLVLFDRGGAQEASQRVVRVAPDSEWSLALDRKSTRLNSSHLGISY